MSLWTVVALGWLGGVAWQTQQADVLSTWACTALLTACGAVSGVAWAVSRGGLPGADSQGVSTVRHLLVHGLAMLAFAGFAWASTDWRATERLAVRIPADWQGRDVPVVVRVEGLPRMVSGAAIFDAQVLQWWPDEAAGAPRRQPREASLCCAPERLAVRLPLSGGELPRAGQRWRLHVRLHDPYGPANPGGFDPTLSFFERGVRAMASVARHAPSPLMLSDRSRWPWQGGIERLRQRTRDAIFASVPDKHAAGVLAGLSVGDQSAIDRADWDIFRKTGLGHVVSISGAHIAMLGWLAAWLARCVWSRWPGGMHVWAASDVALWAGVACSMLYALLAGWGVPAQRTVWMMFLVALMRTGGRQWPWPLVLLGSAVVLTVIDPWCLRQPGFWLSYVAVGVLMSAGVQAGGLAETRSDKPAKAPARMARLRDALARAARATLAAAVSMLRAQKLVTIALTPLIFACFGQVSLIGFFANLIAIPLFTAAITPLALLGMLFEPCWTAGAWLLQQAMVVLSAMAAVSHATSELPALPLWAAIPAVLTGWSLALRMNLRWRVALLPFALVLLYVPQALRMLPPPSASGRFQLLAVDIGQGTAVLVRTARHTLLFDTGPRQGADSNAGERILLPLFRTLGITSLDLLLISHEDTDHVGGAEPLVRELPVAQLLSSLDERHPLRTMSGMGGPPLSHKPCEAGDSWTWDGVRFDILHPTRQDLARRAASPKALAPNAVSCVLRVSAPTGASALLTGDIGEVEEAAIMERAREADDEALRTVRSTILISPHHGSNTSSSEAFLEAVQPRQIVIQAGRRNPYRHPAAQIISRYEAMRLPWQATPDCGAYVWYSDEVAGLTKQAHEAKASDPGEPVIGHCWRHEHQRYWQDQGPSQETGKGPAQRSNAPRKPTTGEAD
jgi:competence protein ComEC